MKTHNSGVMAGFVPAIHGSQEPVVEVIPVGVCREYQAYLPCSRPVLHVPLALSGKADVGVGFRIDQPFQTVSFREAVHLSFAMFPNTSWQITRHAGVKSAIRPIGHDVDPRAFHRALSNPFPPAEADPVDGRDTPGHDREKLAIRYYRAGRVGAFRSCSAKF